MATDLHADTVDPRPPPTAMAHTDRQILQLLDAPWEGVELCRARYERHEFPQHAHGEIHVAAIASGAYRFRHGRREHVAGPRALVVFGAHEAHDGRREGALPYAYAQILVPIDVWHRLLDEEALGPRSLRPGPVIDDPALRTAVAGVFEARVARDALATELALARLARSLAGPCVNAAHDAPASVVERAAAHLRAHWNEAVTLNALVAETGVSRFALTRGFRRRYGVGPHEWLMSWRLQAARRALARGAPPAQVAAEAGFADQAHLARRFRRAYGTTPGAFRAWCTSVQD